MEVLLERFMCIYQRIIWLEYNIRLLKMGRKNSSHGSQGSDFSDVESEEEMDVKVEKAIKALPTLAEKVQAIAINQYIIEKRNLDKAVATEITAIEVKHRKNFEPYLEEIFNIVSGNVDLTDADLEGVDHLLTEQEREVKANYYPKQPIEGYWAKAMLTHDVISETIQPDDEKALNHLTKVECFRSEDGKNFSVTFHFSENEFFTNATIKKEFELDNDEIKRSFGTVIEWKEGKNLTMEIVKKKNKKKKTTTTKQVKKESFFNLFKDIDLTSDDEEEAEENEEDGPSEVEEMERQYEVCNAFYEEILPKSLEFFLGVSGGFGDEEFMNNLLAGGEVEEEDDDEEEEKPKKKSKKNKRKGSHSSKQ